MDSGSRGLTYLYPRLGEVNLHGNFLAGVDVRIVRLLEGSFQFLELGRREGGSYPALFSFLCQHRIVAGVDLVGETGWKIGNWKREIRHCSCVWDLIEHFGCLVS